MAGRRQEMYKKTSCVAMLLAGGQGSRLYELTEHTAKPAVSFGGKYRIIDFPLSNCVNSGIYTVGVLTQYQPLVLNEYIGNGQPWDLDRMQSGVTVLPPYQGKRGGDFYRGTANAIYQNLDFIRRYQPKYVLVLSGDHIYKMDYSRMIQQHKDTGADCTIAVLEVPLSEAGRFGIMTTDENLRITEFEEKPKKPKSTLASMGIYVFSTEVLEKYLEADNEDKKSSKDFGKNVIPAMLADGVRLFAYPFKGYWKDVGTVESLWEANMDLLGNSPVFDIHDREWRIFSRTGARPPHYTGPNGAIRGSLVTEGCEICGTVENSVLSDGVIVESGAVVRNSVIMSNTRICSEATVDYSMIDSGVTVGKNATVGISKEESPKITVVGCGTVIPEGATVRTDMDTAEDSAKGGTV